MFVSFAFIAQQALAQTATDLQADISRKLALGAAKGDLTNAQVMVFKEKVRDALNNRSAQLQHQKLAAIGQQIDHARSSKRSLASRFLPWF